MSINVKNNKNVRIVFNNLLEKASFNTIPASDTYNIPSNVVKTGRDLIWRSSSRAFSFEAVWDTPQLIDTVGVGLHNITYDNLILFELWDEGGMNLLASKEVTNYKARTFCWNLDVTNPVEASILRFKVNNDLNPKSYLDIGRISAGRAFTPYNNLKQGVSVQPVSTASTDRAASGTRIVFDQKIYRTLKFDLEFLELEEMMELYTYLMNKGLTDSFFVNSYPDWDVSLEDSGSGFFSLLSDIPPITHNFTNNFSISFELGESDVIF